MSARSIQIPTVIASPAIGTYRKGLPRTTREPYAAYLWGSDFNSNPLEDVTGNGNTLVNSGDVFTLNQLSIEPTNVNSYYSVPFDADALSNSGTANELTMLFFGKITGAALLTWFKTYAVSGVTRRTDLLTGTAYDVLGVASDGVTDPAILNAGGKSAWRDTSAGMFGLSASIYNRFVFTAHGAGAIDYPNPPAPPSGDVSTLAIGGTSWSTRMLMRADGATPIATYSGALFYDHVLSDDDRVVAYEGMGKLYASYGLDI